MKFLSTPSARRATAEVGRPGCRVSISIHALCEEGDAVKLLLALHIALFLSTPSARRATKRKDWATRMELISIHALCEEGDVLEFGQILRCFGISIHALCEEGDSATRRPGPSTEYFYPRPLRGGRRCSRSSREC